MKNKNKNMMRQNLLATIRNSLGRYIAIMAIIALGAGLFCGLRVTKVDMIATLQKYTQQQNMFDLQAVNNYGWTDKEVDSLAKIEGIQHVEGTLSVDALVAIESTDADPYRLFSIPEQINKIHLDAGRMPQAANECLGDSFYLDESFIGKQITISAQNSKDTREAMAYETYTIVGLVNTPMFLNMQRGSTSVGSGVLETFFYIPRDGFAQEIYSEIYLTLDQEYSIYSDAYDNAMDDMAAYLETYCEPLAEDRYHAILDEYTQKVADGEIEIRDGELELIDAEQEVEDGWKEYKDGLKEYNDAKAEVEKELADALKLIEDAEEELKEGRAKLEDGQDKIDDALKEIEENQALLDEGMIILNDQRYQAEYELAQARAELDTNAATIEANLTQINNDLAQTENSIAKLESSIVPLETAIAQLESQISSLESTIADLDSQIELVEDQLYEARMNDDQELIDQLRPQLEQLQAQRSEYAANLTELQSQYSEANMQLNQLLPTYRDLLSKKNSLLQNKAIMDEVMSVLQDGYEELAAAEADAYAQLDAAEEELKAAQAQIDEGLAELRKKQQEVNNGWGEIREGEKELKDARQEYEDGKATAMKELADAEQELKDAEADLIQAEADIADGWSKLEEAKIELEDAKEELSKAETPTVYILTRNTNLGYVVYENDSDIVNGIAKIFPAFFLAVAALVCITTMTRMVDEERTQIGILKALGYSSTAIMGKYIGYTGSASLIGCSVGMILGTILFPQIIWSAYCIMYNFSPRLLLTYDIPTILFLLISYTTLSLGVTVYCCYRELKVVPAELIRPKAPTIGKKLLIERLHLWRKLNFLNKVAIRNIFRYRQRLAMMLLGIGGCTALLVTGFGLNDSISNVVNEQYNSIVVYDIAVSFEDPLDEAGQQAFRNDFSDIAKDIMFCDHSSMDLEFNHSVKNVKFLVTDAPLDGYITMNYDGKAVPMPGTGEAVISIGAAENMDIEIGDTILIRNAELDEMELVVSGIYDNNVYNYVIITGDTLRQVWGAEPEFQTAFFNAAEGTDIHLVGTQISDTDNVLNITINQDTADMVNGMMDALDAVIIMVVICAGLLAGIVLYNLTNINIKERLREIATIKVLGFRSGETASYVFKENMLLTFFGTLLGLAGGKLLHTTVMSYVRIDMLWFENIITTPSYIWSAILTLVAATIVDFIMYFQLDKINMAEALKSVE